MKWLLAVMVSACAAQSPEALERELDSVARVASVMVDGDVCQRIVTKRALASLGGQTTQLRRSFSEKRSAPILTAHKPLKPLNGAQATAQANYNYNIKEKDGGSDEPRPETGSSSPESQTASPQVESQKEHSEKSRIIPDSPPVSKLTDALKNWGESVRKKGTQ